MSEHQHGGTDAPECTTCSPVTAPEPDVAARVCVCGGDGVRYTMGADADCPVHGFPRCKEHGQRQCDKHTTRDDLVERIRNWADQKESAGYVGDASRLTWIADEVEKIGAKP